MLNPKFQVSNIKQYSNSNLQIVWIIKSLEHWSLFGYLDLVIGYYFLSSSL